MKPSSNRIDDLFTLIREILKHGVNDSGRAEQMRCDSPDQAFIVSKLEDALAGRINSVAELRQAVTDTMVLRQMKQLGVDPNSPVGEKARGLLANDPALEPLVDQSILATARALAGVGE